MKINDKTKHATLRNRTMIRVRIFKDQTHNIYKQEPNEYQRLYNIILRS